MNRLFYGDNLDVLREHVATESVDLVYLDPPFNSARNYNVLFGQHAPNDVQAQVDAFVDTWTWDFHTELEFHRLAEGTDVPGALADAVLALHSLLGESDAMAYLVMMAPRLAELRRVLKPTGSLYLHCDPTMSHYLKILLDSVFGPERFLSEVIWKRSSAHSSAKRYGPVHDVLFVYGKGTKHTWNPQYTPLPADTAAEWYNNVEPETGRRYHRVDLTASGIRSGSSGQPWRGIDPTGKGRHWAIPRAARAVVEGLDTHDALDALDAAGRIHWPKKAGGVPRLKMYLEDAPGVPLQDVWTDIPPLHNLAPERLGYPTQKPQALLERIVSASSNPGDLVLDPFCGCGTTIAAAQALDRQWIGIDVSFVAVDLIDKRLVDTYGEAIRDTYDVDGIPRDLAGAEALFHRDAFEFERWAVSLVHGTPNVKQVGDKGVDGRIRFVEQGGKPTKYGTALVSVKGGAQVNPGMVRDLRGTVSNHKAAMGILITLSEPTKGMRDEAGKSGSYIWPYSHEPYPKVQIITIAELLAGKRPQIPTPLTPYIQASKAARPGGEQMTLGA